MSLFPQTTKSFSNKIKKTKMAKSKSKPKPIQIYIATKQLTLPDINGKIYLIPYRTKFICNKDIPNTYAMESGRSKIYFESNIFQDADYFQADLNAAESYEDLFANYLRDFSFNPKYKARNIIRDFIKPAFIAGFLGFKCHGLDGDEAWNNFRNDFILKK